ncbi:helix-turn-helix domain-containing protein [Coraliomargarita sp. W4R72]
MNDDELLKAFGEAVKRARLSQGWSQEELAEYSGLDRTYVSSVERGKRNVSLINIHRLAIALTLSVSELFEGMEGGYE